MITNVIVNPITNDVVVQFPGPQGAAGSAGSAGATGPTGAIGPAGATGPAGTNVRPNTEKMIYWVASPVSSGFLVGVGESLTSAPTGSGSQNTSGAVGNPLTTAVVQSTSSVPDRALYGATQGVFKNNKIVWQAYYRVSQITGVRAMLGITGGPNTLSSGGDVPGAESAVFRFSTSASDTHFKCLATVNGNQYSADSGVAPNLTNGNRFEIDVDDVAKTIKFYIDGNLVATLTPTVNFSSGSPFAQSFAVSTLDSLSTINAFVGWGYMEILN